MSLPFCTQVVASTSKKHAGLWIALAVATLALGLVHLQPLGEDLGACMLNDQAAPPASKQTQNSTVQTEPTEAELLDSLESRCTSLNKDYLSLQKEVPQVGNEALPLAARLLQDLRNFEVQYTQTMLDDVQTPQYQTASDQNSSSEQSEQELRQAQKALVENKLKRTANRVCFLQLVTAARRLTSSLPREHGNANGALGCAEGMLRGIEEKAVNELELEDSASALSCLGVHWSVLAVNDRTSAPIFGSGPMPKGKKPATWEKDSMGTMAPADMVHAEDLLAQSAQGRGHKRRALSLVHAHRLKEHAKALEAHEQHSAAARRYQSMAKLAEEGGSAPLSAYALSHLSHSLQMHGSQEEALAAAKSAVDLTMDPLAQFVLATVKLSSGLLTNEASLKAAERQLRAVAGQLPTEELEMQRSKMFSEMMMWRWISNGGMKKCLWTGDAARFLICAICKLMF